MWSQPLLAVPAFIGYATRDSTRLLEISTRLPRSSFIITVYFDPSVIVLTVQRCSARSWMRRSATFSRTRSRTREPFRKQISAM